MADSFLNMPSPENVSAFPTEVYEHIIDMLMLQFWDEEDSWRRIRPTLESCSLVCRAWEPRSRLHLVKMSCVTSRESLQTMIKSLRSSPKLAAHVRSFAIIGGGEDQSWISTISLLPKLPNLSSVELLNVDLAQQHVQFP